ncbi:M23 family metallopeptidase [Sediminitomix flava]|uniref:Peptidase M23-like protein n=1 Tax=Sediminitomix flava TaxID=379075 RepID=A0A315ZAF4_SEDFL|nr:M23 family metallopeptidase [Sediminitomix flava]PWJ42521.1 peptidase M23-like protein [Sediminitomix flava]
MAKIKYYYDTETCRYERVKTSTGDIVLNTIGILFLCSLFGILFSAIHSSYFPSAKEVQLIKENEEMAYHYERMHKDLEGALNMMNTLQDRDDNIYRVIFEAEPIPSNIRKGGTGGSEKYKNLLKNESGREDLIIDAQKKLDDLKKQMYGQTKSYDEIAKLAANKSKMLASIPAIQPVSNKDLKRLSSGFGRRLHPILKTWKKHEGVDFSAERGTPIYSTGDGVVKTARKSSGGYGWLIEIDHGFGYRTRYAHMSRFDVKKGDKIKRGQRIGAVGNTGRSTAPHLHYEVIYKNKKIDPVNFFTKDLTPEQYDELRKMAAVENQSLE